MPAARPRRRPTPGRAVAALALAVLAAGACSGGDDEGDRGDSGREATPTTTLAPHREVSLELGVPSVQSITDPPAAIDDATSGAVFDQVEQYVDTAIVTPLLAGEPAAGLESLFTEALAPRVAEGQTDRAALTDEGIGPATADVVVTADDPVALDVLAGADGAVLLVAATATMHIETETAEGPLQINRRVELTFERPDGTHWLVSGYRVLVGRETPAGSSSETATTEPAGTTPDAPVETTEVP